jgi:hypothetical protein
MADGGDVLSMLIPSGGWVITGDSFESIIYDEGVEPISKKEFDDGFAVCDAWKALKEAETKTKKDALLTRLGITADEAALLLS